jgi:hypothetical protein
MVALSLATKACSAGQALTSLPFTCSPVATLGANTFTGNQSINGNVSAKQLISTVATGTAPLSVASTTQVANLNASLLGGRAASAFAQTGVQNSFVARQAFAGSGINMFVGDPGCNPGFAGIGFNGLSGCSDYSMIGDGTNTILNRPSGGALYFRENNANQLSIASGGLVGIGTLSPTATLDVIAVNASYPGIGTSGFTPPRGSNGSGTAGVVTYGGNGDVTDDFARGGDGIVANPGVGGIDGGEGYAGLFNGSVDVMGFLTKSSGSFKIDHPLDPANKYLYHSFVESPDMMNIYNGNAVLDANGEASVILPDWFEALNRDFRYQLTCIGGFARVYIAQKVQNNSFRIAGGHAGMEVSWQVTGIRQDDWANAHRIPVDVEKSERERGYFIHPELYGAPEEKGMEWARYPEMMKQMKEMREKQVKPRQAMHPKPDAGE